jgi:hypothetical protein
MTLEQRVEALEKIVANLTMPSGKAEELAKMMRDVAAETIRNARRPGGALHKLDHEKGNILASDYTVKIGINCDADRDGALDHIATVLRESPILSRL